MTAAERLVALAGIGGTAGALLLMIGTGATAGAALVDYSQLPTGTAAEHLLVDHAVVTPTPIYGGGGGKHKHFGRYYYRIEENKRHEIIEVIEEIAKEQVQELIHKVNPKQPEKIFYGEQLAFLIAKLEGREIEYLPFYADMFILELKRLVSLELTRLMDEEIIAVSLLLMGI